MSDLEWVFPPQASQSRQSFIGMPSCSGSSWSQMLTTKISHHWSLTCPLARSLGQGFQTDLKHPAWNSLSPLTDHTIGVPFLPYILPFLHNSSYCFVLCFCVTKNQTQSFIRARQAVSTVLCRCTFYFSVFSFKFWDRVSLTSSRLA